MNNKKNNTSGNKEVSKLSLPYNIMNTFSEKVYDDITKLASVICDTPISTITFFDESRQFFKSRHGLDISETPIEDSFCRHVLDNSDELMIIPDAQKDDRFRDNPSVVGDPKIVFYAGYQVKNDKGVPFATLCIIDQKVRELTDIQKEALKSLANQVEQLLELRKSKLELEFLNASIVQEKNILDNVIEGTDAGTWEWDITTDEVLINEKWFQLLGHTSKPYEVFTMKNWKELIFADDLYHFEEGLTNCLSGISEKFHFKYRIKHLKGNWIWVENRGKVVQRSKNGKALNMFGIQLNIDKEKVQEDQFHTIADSIPGAVFRYEIAKDGTDNLTYVSNGFLDLWGVSAEAAMEDNNRIWSLILDEDLPNVQKSIEQSATHMTNWVSEWRIKQPNGAIKWHKGIGKPAKTSDGVIYWDSIILDITEEKLISENLEKRNEFIEVVLENLPIGIAVNDMVTGAATIVNHQFSEIYGWPSEELLDVTSFFEKIYPNTSYREKIKNRILSDIQSGDLERMSWKGIFITGKKGEEKFVDAKNIPLYNQNLMISTVLDNTEQYLYKKELSDINERFKLATQATSDIIWDYDLVKGELHWGENYELIFGYKPNKVPTKNIKRWEEQLHPEDRERVVSSLESAINGKENYWVIEYRFQKRNGKYIDVLDKGFVVRDKVGIGIRMVGAMQDITVQKQREHQLKLFESVINHSADPIIITDAESLEYPDGPKIIYVNEAFKKSTGYSDAEILGKTPRILQGPKSDKATLKQMGSDLRSWKKIDVDVLNYTKEGEGFWVNLSIAPVANEKGWYTHWISIQKDITAKKNKALFQDTLNSISNIFNQQQSLKNTLGQVLNILIENFKASVAEIWIVSSDKSIIYMAENYLSEPLFESFSKEGLDLKGTKKGDGLQGKTWNKRQLQYWQDTEKEEELIRYKSAKSIGVKSAFGIPLIFKEEVVGVIILAQDRYVNSNNLMVENLMDLGGLLGVELARKKLEEELNQLIKFAPGYICSLDDKGYFRQVNPAFGTIIGSDNRELFEINFIDIVHPLDRSVMVDIIHSFELGNPIVSSEIRCLTPENKIIWILWSFTPASELGISYGVGKDITEKKELENLLDKATDLARIGSWEIDLVENKIYWSKITKQIHEVPLDFEPNLETAFEFYKEGEDRNSIDKMITNTIENGEFFTDELRIISYKGKEIWIKVMGEPEIVNDKIIKIYGSVQDIDQRKRAELERVQILESIGDGFFAVDSDWIVTYWNQKAETILDISKNEILGKNLRDLLFDSLNKNFYDQYQLAIKENRAVHFEAKYEPVGIWLDVSAYPNKDSQGLTVYFKDVTIRKEAIDQIKYSNERFSKIAQATQDAIWDWDIQNNTLFWGSGFQDRFGQNILEKDLTVEKWSSLIHPNDRPKFFNNITESLKDTSIEYFKNEYRFLRKNNKYAYVIDSAYILRGKRGEPVRLVGAIQDITERKKYEESLKMLNNQLTIKAKLLETSNAELEQFAYVASHDLQEPLRMITSFLTLLENRYADKIDEKGKQYINLAVDGATRMREIILELLDYSRVGNMSDKIEEVDVKALVDEVMILHKKQIHERGAQIVTHNLPIINGFKSPMRQIFLNLISNSIKYCDDDKTPKISVSCSHDEDFWKFSVKDNGIGIDPTYFEKIFIIFQRLHNQNEFSGTGMGLSITKKIVETLGGKIWVDSSEGKGSTFTFTIKKNN